SCGRRLAGKVTDACLERYATVLAGRVPVVRSARAVGHDTIELDEAPLIEEPVEPVVCGQPWRAAGQSASVRRPTPIRQGGGAGRRGDPTRQASEDSSSDSAALMAAARSAAAARAAATSSGDGIPSAG